MYYKAFKDRSYCFQAEMFMTVEISAENNSFENFTERKQNKYRCGKSETKRNITMIINSLIQITGRYKDVKLCQLLLLCVPVYL